MAPPPTVIPMNRYMLSLLKKLRQGRSESTVWSIFESIVRLRDRVPTYSKNPALPERFNDLIWLTDTADIAARISERAATNHSAFSYYKNILAAFAADASEIYQPTVILYRAKLIELSAPINEAYSAGDPTVPKWDHLIAHRDEIDITSMAYFIMCLYTMIPPLRSDFSEMDFIAKESDAVSPTMNYYCMESKTIILNAYKTQKQYGPKRITVPDDLHEIVIRFQTDPDSKMPFYSKPLLKGPSGCRLSQARVGHILTKSFGKPLGPSAIRKSFVHVYGDSLTTAAANADAMCHSLAVAAKCYAK